MDDTERRAILAEIIALTEPTTLIQPWQFTTADFMREAGLQHHANASLKLKRLVAAGVLRSDANGYNPTTGRKVTLFWRPEDER
jgi:hypothetical protein